MAGSAPFVLYHHPYSICSLMVRLTLAMRGRPKDLDSEMTVEERVVDIFNSLQLEEDFLCNINPKGQVPVLVHQSDGPKALPDSLEITLYIAKLYPELIPDGERSHIIDLLRELHSVNYFSLSFQKKPAYGQGLLSAVLERLQRPGISPRYQKALEYKLTVVDNEKVDGLTRPRIAEAEDRTRSILKKMEDLLNQQPPESWVFGSSSPTALDAHLIIFIARLCDIGRKDLIPKRVLEYGEMATKTPEWDQVMQGKRTVLQPVA
ncbi:hypothetical protein F5884DRAFT_784746 [Xylogone sp. PMI_703]|nr:hypothetical protein F5884DRAFT_784746 [Xylogone sp. PMI_703]